jgi:predicted amidophosphoribosyltransferase
MSIIFLSQWIKTIVKKIIFFFIEQRCRYCERLLSLSDDIFCFSCLDKIQFLAPLMHQKKYPLYALGHYDGILRFIVTEKYRQKRLSYYALFDKIVSLIDFYRIDFDVVVPVPKTTWNMFSQKVNPPALVAEFIAQKFKKNLFTEVYMTKYKNNQSGQPHAARAKMEEDTFFIPLSSQSALINKKILLVDDVATSGRTIDVMIHQLSKIKSCSMSVFVIARK